MPELKCGKTLVRLAEDAQRRLDDVIQSNEGLQRLMGKCESLILGILSRSDASLF